MYQTFLNGLLKRSLVSLLICPHKDTEKNNDYKHIGNLFHNDYNNKLCDKFNHVLIPLRSVVDSIKIVNNSVTSLLRYALP